METNAALKIEEPTPSEAFVTYAQINLAPIVTTTLVHLANTFDLTRKERAVLELIFDGHPDKDIAEKLGNTVKCIKHHTQAIYAKAHVAGRHHLFALALGRRMPDGMVG